MENFISVIIFVVWIVIWAFGQAQKANKDVPQGAFDPTSMGPNTQAVRAPEPAYLQSGVQHVRSQIEVVLDDVHRAGPVARPLETTTERLQEVLEQVRQGVDQYAATWPSSSLAQRLHTGIQLERSLQALDQRLQVAQTLVRARTDREASQRMGDGDSVAAAFLHPFSAFARAEGIAFPDQDPIAAPAAPQHESVIIGMLPGNPVVFVPANFDEDIFRWPAVPHEIAHVIWHETPGLAAEVRDVLRLRYAESLATQRGATVDGVLSKVFSAWAPELFADWLTVMQCGPAALRGFSHSFGSLASPHPTVGVRSNNTYDEHPPVHVRMLLANALLYRMGFDRESLEIIEAWTEAHGSPSLMYVPIEGGNYVSVPLSEVFRRGTELTQRFYDQQWAAISSRSFSSIHDFAMTPGAWARTKRRMSDLLNAAHFHDDPRTVVCAAIEARHQNPSKASSILRATRRAIIGRGEGLRSRRDASWANTSKKLRNITKAEFRDALVWSEVLERKGAPRHGANS